MDFFLGRNVLVAGATGFVGSHLTDRLVSLGANVTGTLHKSNSGIKNESARYTSVDLENAKDCELVTKDMEFVFMCAANSSGAEVMDKTPLVHLTPNVIMNSQMLAASYLNGVKKFCFISSNTVYPLTDFAVAEKDVTGEFFDKYFIVGWMKRFSELMCEMYSKKINNPMSTLIIRPGNLYGPRDKFKTNESKVIAALIRRVAENKNPLEVWGDGEDIKDFLYIDDFVDALIVTFKKSGDFDVYNIASGVPITIKEVIINLLQISGNQNTEVKFDPSKPTMIPIRMIDISKIKSEIGWYPKTSLYEGLAKTYKWYVESYQKRNRDGQKE